MNAKMWALLKKHILTKPSHGKNELLQAMCDLEIAEASEKKDVPDDKLEQLRQIQQWEKARYVDQLATLIRRKQTDSTSIEDLYKRITDLEREWITETRLGSRKLMEYRLRDLYATYGRAIFEKVAVFADSKDKESKI